MKTALQMLVCRSVCCVLLVCAAGCAHSSLQRPVDFDTVVRPLPIVVACATVSDSVPCDNESLYLQRYLDNKRVFYDCVLADPQHPRDYHDADLVISGEITPRIQPRRRLGWGIFCTVITGGAYYFLGGPVSVRDCAVAYDFQVYYADTGRTENYRFTDTRHVVYGITGPPIPMATKPALYESGWDQLLYLMCKALQTNGPGSAYVQH